MGKGRGEEQEVVLHFPAAQPVSASPWPGPALLQSFTGWELQAGDLLPCFASLSMFVYSPAIPPNPHHIYCCG